MHVGTKSICVNFCCKRPITQNVIYCVLHNNCLHLAVVKKSTHSKRFKLFDTKLNNSKRVFILASTEIFQVMLADLNNLIGVYFHCKRLSLKKVTVF